MTEDENKAEEETRKFILRERLGWLRSQVQYIPSVLKKRYLEALEDVKELTL